MKINEVSIRRQTYLYEGLDKQTKNTMRLWESVGLTLVEAQLSQDQIIQLFRDIEQSAQASGTNRTVLGKGVDVASKVNQTYQSLKNAVQTSATMQYFDQKYEDAAAKLKQATGGDQGVMQYVQKYRDFAKSYPKAQSFIYAALIAAAGISGAGAGGAAALGLLKMTDKLLQGEKFSTAAIKGAETGAMAYAAGKVGQAMNGDTTTTSPTVTQHTTGMQPANPWDIPNSFKQRYPVDKFVYKSDGMDYYEIFDKAGNKVANFDTSPMESFLVTGPLVNKLFETIITEGAGWDKFKAGMKQAAGGVGQMASGAAQGAKAVAQPVIDKTAQKIHQTGINLSNKITLDKLHKAWTQAGSPTDSEELRKVLQGAKVDDELIDTAYKKIGIPVRRHSGSEPAPTNTTSSKKSGSFAGGLLKGVAKGVVKGVADIASPGLYDKVSTEIPTQIRQTQQDKKYAAAYDKRSAELAKQSTPEVPHVEPEDYIDWNPDKSILSINGIKYQKSKKGWMDWETKEQINPVDAKELDTAFDKITGRVPQKSTVPPTTKLISRVTTPQGYVASKWDDGVWTYNENGEEVIVNKKANIDKLEQLLATSGYEPAVFTSNRPAK